MTPPVPVSGETHPDLAGRLVRAVEKALDENIRNPFDARNAAVAMLREMDRIYHERDSSFEQLDAGALADEIEGAR